MQMGQDRLMINGIHTEIFDSYKSMHNWIATNTDIIKSILNTTGGILFRNSKSQTITIENFKNIVQLISSELEEYKEHSTARVEIGGNIYTSTEHPPDQEIPFHNECSYAHSWPLKIWFNCVKSVSIGGETPIADSRKVFDLIDNSIKKKFIEKKVMYVRNFNSSLGLPWQTTFQTEDKDVVKAYCESNGIDCEWINDKHLRTIAIRPAAAKHPFTGEYVWFNQAHAYHISSIHEKIRDLLIRRYGEHNIPKNAYYGDGTPIEDDVLNEIRMAYKSAEVRFQWQEGDILLLDNMLMSHGRSSFQGERKVVVAMTEPWQTYGM